MAKITGILRQGNKLKAICRELKDPEGLYFVLLSFFVSKIL